MPIAAPRICFCGKVVPNGVRCACRARQKREADQRRPSARQRGYTSKWDKARAEFLVGNPICSAPGCDMPATVVDHIEAHKGDMRLFWNRRNWQSLCKRHHDGWKQRIECKAS